MTARAGFVAFKPDTSLSLDGGKDSPNEGAILISSPQGRVSRLKMIAVNSLNQLVYWIVTGSADPTASKWTGGNTPLTKIAVGSEF